MSFNIYQPKKGTNPYRLLELIAICGELPTSLLHRLPYSYDYARAIIGKLKKEGFVRTYSSDKLKGYRLNAKAKKLLLESDPPKFSFYLSGNAETNIIRSELTRRIRLHRLSECYVLMLNAGVSVFGDEENNSVFHSSRKIKEDFRETLKIKGSRMMGVLETSSDIFTVYNIGSSYPKWNYQSELRAKIYIRSKWHRQPVGIIISHCFDRFIKVFETADGNERCFFLLDNTYEHFYYLTQNTHGEVLIRLLCNTNKTEILNQTLMQGYTPAIDNYHIIHDALDENNEPVLFGYFMDIPRISRFLTALNMHGKHGTIICFDFQQNVIEHICGKCVKVKAISFDKFKRRFFECEEK